MKRIFFLLLFCVSIFPVIPPGMEGAYNKLSGMMICTTKSSCYHEIAHKLDQQGGWISHTSDFSMSVETYIWVEFSKKEPNPLVYSIVTMPGLISWNGFFVDDNAELYARIFEKSNGKKENMPEIFRKFYDWDRAIELIEEVMR